MPDDDKNIFRVKRTGQGFTDTPCCMYFYYIKSLGRRVDPFIRRYYYVRDNEHIFYEELEDLVRDLTVNARKDADRQDPPPDGDSLDHNVWSRKSYIAFVLDNWNTTFVEDEPILLDHLREGKINRSFFDGWCRRVDMPPDGSGSNRRSVLCFMNHMKRGAFGDLRRENAFMSFRLNIRPPPFRGYPDSGGTNMGPPIGPP
jgi:hypothetical protein